MRVPLRWLGEFVDLPTAVTPEAVHAALVRVGLEEEAIHRPEVSGPIVVGEVLAFEAEPQSNGKTIRWCQVRVAADADGTPDAPAVRGIVCGAHNFVVGDRVVVTLPGAVLPGPFPIAARRTYGHVSDGMLASARELGLGEDHAGILRLTTLGIDAPVGTDAIALLGLDDAAVELNVTPDRGYALSIRGVAREYALATDAPFRDPVDALRAALDATPAPHSDTVSHPGVTLVDDAPIHNRVGCDVFATAVVQDVDGTRPTPPWLVARLRLAGVRPLSVLVDITNYVMLELGQPIHGYDADRLRGDIVVRRARPGERLTTLDAKDRALDPEDLLITDDRGPIGLAGVMGGADTELTATTRTVLIEAAHFDPVSIARTARRHRLPSEASRRFERGVDPAIAAAAATRVADLLCALAGGHRVGAVRVTGESATPAPITLPTDAVRLRVGIDPTLEVQADILRRVGARVDRVAAHQDALPAARPAAQALSVTPPTWRPDLTASEDLVEEIARLVGYDTIPSLLPQAPPGVGFTPDQRLRRAVIDAVVGAGATEILSFPFVSSADNARCGGVVRAASFPPALSHPVSAGRRCPRYVLPTPLTRSGASCAGPCFQASSGPRN